jgi:hypothetical protein
VNQIRRAGYWLGQKYLNKDPKAYNLVMAKLKTPVENLPELAREAKAIVALAFRNGPIEDVHSGKTCPTCHGKAEYSHITQGEMRQILKFAVDQLYTFLVMKKNEPKAYEALIACGEQYTVAWDEPVLTKDLEKKQ